MIAAEDILRFVRSRRYRPMAVAGIAEHFGVAEDEFDDLSRQVHDLELAGEIVEVKRGCLASPEKVGMVVGVLRCNPRGFGFVVPLREQDGVDVYVHGEDQDAAMHGDLVVVNLTEPGRRRRHQRDLGPSGKVVRVVRHARAEVLGTFRKDRSVAYVEPDDKRLYQDIYVAHGDAMGAKSGDKVRIRMTAWPSRHLNPEGVVEDVLGTAGDLGVETRAVIRGFGLREAFPDEVLAAAERLPQRVSPQDVRDRQDLRDVLTFTIDPEDAKDHDDAVSIQRVRGGWELGVHIADVAHYVADMGVIDGEARERGTSVYLPGMVLPMLPEALSNNLCSLREGRVRLTRSVLMRFDGQGALVRQRIVPSVIRSRRSLSYQQVQTLFQEGDAQLGGEMTDALGEARKLAALLRDQRRRRGMIVMDLPEVRAVVGPDGETERIDVRHQDEAHSLIEHFMLSANEVVARFLAEKGLPCVARVHDAPGREQLSEMRDALKALGYSLGLPGTPKQIQQVIDRAGGREESRAVNITILRAMCRAEYSPHPTGHYALAARHYTHFTSPIRRYPDLLVHRILTEHESGLLRDADRQRIWQDRLGPWLIAASDAERRSEDAERELTRRRVLDALLKEPDQALEAIVTDVSDRGAVVELTQLAFEGRIPFRHLAGDYYRVDRRRRRLVGRRGHQIRVGQSLSVRIAEADPVRGEVLFAPAAARKR